jgi:hypothetical protein
MRIWFFLPSVCRNQYIIPLYAQMGIQQFALYLCFPSVPTSFRWCCRPSPAFSCSSSGYRSGYVSFFRRSGNYHTRRPAFVSATSFDSLSWVQPVFSLFYIYSRRNAQWPRVIALLSSLTPPPLLAAFSASSASLMPNSLQTCFVSRPPFGYSCFLSVPAFSFNMREGEWSRVIVLLCPFRICDPASFSFPPCL